MGNPVFLNIISVHQLEAVRFCDQKLSRPTLSSLSVEVGDPVSILIIHFVRLAFSMNNKNFQ
jgi:hypothetical protein